MKVVILAGGLGTRLSEETGLRPKPMVEIGGRPILCHIMDIYTHYGFVDFVVCLGYRGYMIKEYFQNYLLHVSDVTFDFSKSGTLTLHESRLPPWRVTLVETGESTQTGGRLRRVREFLGEESFMLTYGDGVADIDVSKLVDFHKGHGKSCTVTAVQPPGRFGAMVLDEAHAVERFEEKPQGDGGWINGGFFVMEPAVLDLIDGDETVLEREPLQRLADSGNLVAYRHDGFWHAMDTLRDKRQLETMWERSEAPWRR